MGPEYFLPSSDINLTQPTPNVVLQPHQKQVETWRGVRRGQLMGREYAYG